MSVALGGILVLQRCVQVGFGAIARLEGRKEPLHTGSIATIKELGAGGGGSAAPKRLGTVARLGGVLRATGVVGGAGILRGAGVLGRAGILARARVVGGAGVFCGA